MEQQPQEDVISSLTSTTVVTSVSTPTTSVVSTASIGDVQPALPTNTVTRTLSANEVPPSVPFNVDSPVLLTSRRIPLQMLPSAPASAQLPSLINPPLVSPLVEPTQLETTNNAVVDETDADVAVPSQAQFETLSLNQSVSSVVTQLSMNNDRVEQQLSFPEIHDDLNSIQEFSNSNLVVFSLNDSHGTANSNDESSKILEEIKNGAYFKIIMNQRLNRFIL